MRNYPRKFDWDEARRLRDGGLSYPIIASRLGVSQMAVYRVCNPEFARRAQVRTSEYQRTGTCPVCGGQASRNYTGGQHRCRGCANKASTTSVCPGELRCPHCEEWKPDRDFPRDRSLSHRRGRSRFCRACQTVMKRAWREKKRVAA